MRDIHESSHNFIADSLLSFAKIETGLVLNPLVVLIMENTFRALLFRTVAEMVGWHPSEPRTWLPKCLLLEEDGADPGSCTLLWLAAVVMGIGCVLSHLLLKKAFLHKLLSAGAKKRSLRELKEYCYSFHMAWTVILNYLPLKATADISIVIKCNKTKNSVFSMFNRRTAHWIRMSSRVELRRRSKCPTLVVRFGFWSPWDLV